MQVTLKQFVRNFQQACAQAGVERSIQLGKGQCKDLEEYKRSVGFIAGIDAASSLADQMLRQIEEADAGGDLPPMPQPPQQEGATQ